MISVVIPNYNGEKYLADCLDAVERQTCKDFEVILIDDCSTDTSASMVREKYPWVQLTELKENTGFCKAVNEGIRRSKGEYIVLLNNDTRPAPTWLEALRGALDHNPDVGFCASKMVYMDDPEILNSAGMGMTNSGSPYSLGAGMSDAPEFNVRRPVFGACAGAAIYRRAMLDDIGLFDEDIYMFYEDVDLSFRAQLCGYRCLYVPEAVVYHVGGGSVASMPQFYKFLTCRNSITVLVKNMPASLWLKNINKIAWLYFKHTLKTLLQGDTVHLRGYLSGLWALRYSLPKRRELQRRRSVTVEYIDSLLEDKDSMLKKMATINYR